MTNRAPGHSSFTLNRRAAMGLGAAAGLGFGSHAYGERRNRASAESSEARYTHSHTDPGENPVLFWNAVSLDLAALDHSIDPASAAAPGPCASARALGVIHAVIADAVSVAYRASYRPQFYNGAPPQIQVPALFVGGAAAGIMAHIFNSPIHIYSIGASRQRFQRTLGNNEANDWQQGLAFSGYQRFRDMWNWNEMRRKLLPQLSNYIPRPRRHNIDPYNPGQGFYGTTWGTQEPLIVASNHIAGLSVPPPPPEGSPEYERDLAEVAVVGELVSRGNARFPARTPGQTNTGLFWAYDGSRLIGVPGRLYNHILRRIAIDDGLDMAEMARLFALCNIAMADASIITWYAKYKYAVWRPVIGIQNHAISPIPDWRPLGSPRTNPSRFQLGPEMFASDTAQALVGGGASLLAQQLHYSDHFDYVAARRRFDEEGDKYGQAAFTPNFPSYPSGHAAFGGACFGMLKLLRSERPETAQEPDRIDALLVSEELNGISIDNFHDQPRPFRPVRFTSIDDMIEDNDSSRVFLGVHWRFDCNRGSESGRRIAEKTYGKAYHAGR